MSPTRLSVWPTLSPGVYARRPESTLPFPLEEPNCSLFARARHALWQGVQALRLRPGDEVLAPAYHHGSEIEALRRAGLGIRFYDGGTELEPDPDELETLLGPGVRALHLTHYLGFPQDAARWRAWCDERELLLLEDAAQAWLASADSRPVGSHGDLAIFCLYKTFGLPDGGALLVRAPAPGPESRRRLALVPLARRHALWLMERSEALASLADGTRRDHAYVPEEDFALGNAGSPPASPTLFLLPRVVDRRAAVRRRANYGFLLEALGELAPPPFSRLPAGAVPFAFPIASERKAELLERLTRRGISALDFWSVPHGSLPADRFPKAAARRATTIALPVHQELRPAELERIAAAVRDPRPRRRELHLEVVDSLEDLREDWRALGNEGDNIFATWEWGSIWWRHFGGGKRLLLGACRNGQGRVVAVIPLYVFSERPLRIIRFLGHGSADQLGPVCLPPDRPAVARALREAVGLARPDLFLGEHLPAQEAWGALLGGRVLRDEASPVLTFTVGTWDELLATWSANRRGQIRRLERKLEREHGLRYRLADDPDRLQADLDILFSLHSARWQKEQSAFTSSQAEFQREFADRALELGWLRLWFLEADGQPVSAWYGFRFNGVESYYQAGRDPAWEHRSVGLVLLTHTIRAALEDGMREYRFLRGGEAFKFRFANDDPGLETIGLARGPLGDAAMAASLALPGPLALPLRRRLVG